ncbi:Diacylglycerol kinase, catalytic domain and ATP-NAD kinase-like domain-containing protein [Strongyloides ratti]|uniref:Diacylglycerol kinase, catalytic domain and ATP-NAD kinase-like domain-containing protein n=1 Tax=Strongyloides ratti TaxID=34506 RepID=A0A090MNZ1_STRRB|nr:Diacylglycerol kinase, catalytic domain and ATP-NAD kinase-like domain-containing protein [Strongyloides ratti]CEF59796.1 Diacylglycerol kinase, catalytic domain and ATP-NAD kinase-like domain-containing protein [Strongyloides ratti]
MIKKIFCCCNDNYTSEEITNECNISNECKKKVLIFLNPNSGSGTTLIDFNKRLLPALRKNNIFFEVIRTEGKNHCLEVAKNIKNLYEYNAVIIMSGDGLIFEWINGICQRDNKIEIFNNIPIGIVPTGSGNGLLSSIFFANNISLQKQGFQERAIEIISSNSAVSSYVNLIHIESESSNYTSFLSVGWGLLANIDIDSERWRKTLGSHRFFLEALLKVVHIPSYKGKLWYTKRNPNINYENFKNERKNFVYSDDKIIKKTDSQLEFDRESNQQEDDLRIYHLNKNIPSIKDPIPTSWNVIDEEFVFIYAVTLSHISRDGFYMPPAKLDDPNIYLTYCLRKDLPSRRKIIKFLIDIEDGKHCNHSFINIIKVDSFRLESQTNDSPIVIDGEKINEKVIQATTTELKMSVICNKEDS